MSRRSLRENAVGTQFWASHTHCEAGFTLDIQLPGLHSKFLAVTSHSASWNTLRDVSEVLFWAATACRSSSDDSCGYCSSRSVIQSGTIGFEILPLEMTRLDTTISETNGLCWTKIFHNPMLVRGYPIPHRRNDEPGLQISFGLMALLSDARRATIFDGMLVLKSFCTMLVYVAQRGSSGIWHFLRNDDLSWMCYNQARPFASRAESFEPLAAEGHFVGWAHESYSNAGTEQAKYDSITYAGQIHSRPGIAIDGLAINAAKVFSVGAKVVPGNKDRWLYHDSILKGHPFQMMVSMAEKMHVVFYGVDDRRAWLLDGASALLHLSRAALTHKAAPHIETTSISLSSSGYSPSHPIQRPIEQKRPTATALSSYESPQNMQREQADADVSSPAHDVTPESEPERDRSLDSTSHFPLYLIQEGPQYPL